MKVLEVFFDYACPFCLRAHELLDELISSYPQVEIKWRPCEAHPRPEAYGLHSDLCIQGMYFAMEHGVDLAAYHDRMYRAALVDKIDIEDIETLSDYVSDLLDRDTDAFSTALREGLYAEIQKNGNDYAYERSGVWAVPAYRMDGERLDAVEDIGVTKEQLKAFLEHSNTNLRINPQ